MSLELELKRMLLEIEKSRVSVVSLEDIVTDDGDMRVPFYIERCPFSVN